MGIFLMVVAFVGFFFPVVVMVMVMFLRLDPCNAPGRVDGIGTVENILHEFLQSRTGNHNDLRCLGGLHLPDIQGIVMEAGNLLRHQPGDSQSAPVPTARSLSATGTIIK